MATKTKPVDSTTEIKNYRKLGRLCFGMRQTTHLLRSGGAEKVYLAANCPDDVRKEMERFCRLSEVPVHTLKILSDELGVLCRRQHTILVLGLRKE